MRVLVAGSGGREHALVWKIARSPLVERVYAAPGNAGMAAQSTLVPEVEAGDAEGLIRLAGEEGIDLVVIGPEDPLADGVADRLREAGVVVFGPSREVARLEGSKSLRPGVHGTPRNSPPRVPQLRRVGGGALARPRAGWRLRGEGRRPGSRQGRQRLRQRRSKPSGRSTR